MNAPVFKDLLVVELASVLAGPSVGQFFAELGATVIKVENAATRGDVTRTWKLSTEEAATDVSAYFAAANWGKHAVALDITQPAALAALHELVAKADVVLASYKPGDAEKLRVDYHTLSQLNPPLIYAHITGYGTHDSRAGYDAVVQAESGFMYMNGEHAGPPTKMPVALVDILAAHQLKEAILTALYQRTHSGKGQYVTVSLLEAAVSALANQATNYLVAGHNPQRMGSAHPNIVPYGSVFTDKNGQPLVLAIGDDRQFKRLCDVLGAPALATDAGYATNKARVQHRDAVNQELARYIEQQDREALLQALHQQHVPAGAVNSVAEVFSLPQAREMMLLHPDAKPGVRQVAFKGTGIAGNAAITPPPAYAQDNAHVLEHLAGLPADEAAALAPNDSAGG
ncbi:CaiB/BaiF CoA transferase family protein [Pontibacter roseus]|uniref:CaiB/BaiF CoA transferase family protein n=1 Tax=Pontibacter roseus TaxID=336989 RepID=UPI0003746298|nr:CaiB/BaiF CoA-transferase family protein [Pontibacter roseus]